MKPYTSDKRVPIPHSKYSVLTVLCISKAWHLFRPTFISLLLFFTVPVAFMIITQPVNAGNAACGKLYRPLSAIVAQHKNCHLKLIFRFRWKIKQLHPTTPASMLVGTYPARCHYCNCYIFYLNCSINFYWAIFGLCHYCTQWTICLQIDKKWIQHPYQHLAQQSPNLRHLNVNLFLTRILLHFCKDLKSFIRHSGFFMGHNMASIKM